METGPSELKQHGPVVILPVVYRIALTFQSNRRKKWLYDISEPEILSQRLGRKAYNVSTVYPHQKPNKKGKSEIKRIKLTKKKLMY